MGFVQARIKKFMLSSEVGEEGGKVNNKRRLDGTQAEEGGVVLVEMFRIGCWS